MRSKKKTSMGYGEHMDMGLETWIGARSRWWTLWSVSRIFIFILRASGHHCKLSNRWGIYVLIVKGLILPKLFVMFVNRQQVLGLGRRKNIG